MGCLNCPQTEEKLEMDTVMYNGFGGYTLRKNGEYFESADVNLEWYKNPTAQDFEKLARKDKKAKWEIEMNLPLRDATWERKGRNNWILTKKGNGFA